MSDTTDQRRLAEAMLFAAAEPLTTAAIGALLEPGVDAAAVVAEVQARYAGGGVELVAVAGGWQFRTAADLAPRLTRVIVQPRRLPRAAMEVLAVIAYQQPATRAEIEAVRGASLGQPTLDLLLEAGLIRSLGRKEVPGRPTLWATTSEFLVRFGLNDLSDLPRREELIVEGG